MRSDPGRDVDFKILRCVMVNEFLRMNNFSVSGDWFARTAKLAVPSRQELNGDDENSMRYVEDFYQAEDGMRLGVYQSMQASDEKPPVMVFVGGLGFGGPVPANSWRRYLKNWSPLLVDSRGSGRSVPFAATHQSEPDLCLNDFEDIQRLAGYQSMGYVGYSFAANYALWMAERSLRAGRKVPFVAVTSPVLCTGDRTWCFNRLRNEYVGPPEIQQRLQETWKEMIAPVDEAPFARVEDAVLNWYDQALNDNTSFPKFLDAFIRMANWEATPYNYDLWEPEKVVADLKYAAAIPFDLFVAKLMLGTLDLAVDARQEEGIKDEDERSWLRESMRTVRYVANMKLWIRGWQKNCWLDEKTGILSTLKFLRERKVPALILLNREDPLLPESQAVVWQKAWPEAVRVLDGSGHGLSSPQAQNMFFEFLETRRGRLANADRSRVLRQRNLWALKDLGQAVELLSSDVMAAVCFVVAEGGSKAAMQKSASLVQDVLNDFMRDDVSAMVDAYCDRTESNFDRARMVNDVERILPFVNEKRMYLAGVSR